MQDFNEALNAKFNGISGNVTSARRYSAGPNDFELTLYIKIDSEQWNRLKRKKIDPINGLHLVVDLSNFLYRSLGLGVYCPEIGGIKARAKNGIKTLSFSYQITGDDLAALGLERPEFTFGYYGRVQLGPIKTDDNLALVVNG